MADPTDTPTDTPATPATPRRRGPRKTGTAKAPATRRRAADKSIVASAEEAVTGAATSATRRVKRGAVKAEEAVVAAVKSATPSTDGRRKPAAKKAAAAKGSSAAKGRAKGKGKRSGWGVAAVVGGLAATGAAAAALLSLKGSGKSGAATRPTDSQGGAHQPDGTDASQSFDAGIADENTVPN